MLQRPRTCKEGWKYRLAASEDAKTALKPTRIWKCRNADCRAWVREEFATPNQACPLCGGPMLRSMKHLPPLQNKVKARAKS
ncbi:cold-inducible protein YdjO-related protein [Cohnella laeviribosi]|uniref:cold-inducible protein YdjO-related protein n=1 Tax=Cohnella laeviribosi TaxID=380174 RepID=UPI000686E38B|nr:cold-inducible protein YdjO-related protein [Cohnella laeviribosi]